MNSKTLTLFALLCVFWGIPYFFIKLALVDLSPVCVAWSRITLGALVLLPIAWHRNSLPRVLAHPWAILAFGVMELVVPFSLIAMAERSISSSLTGVLVAAVPLTILFMAPLFGVRERLSPRRLIGLGLGLLGVIVLLGFESISGTEQWLAVAGLFIAILGYATAPLVVQRHLAGVDEIGSVAMSLAVASVILLPFAIATRPDHMPSALSLVSVGVLGVLSTAAAMLLYFYVIHAAGAARASLVAYISPAVAAVLGVGFLHEPFGISMVVGLGLILLGSALGSGGSRAAGPQDHECSTGSDVIAP